MLLLLLLLLLCTNPFVCYIYIKEGCENKPALLILLIFYLKEKHKNLTFHWTKTIENGGKSYYEINVFLKYTLDTIIGNIRNSYA